MKIPESTRSSLAYRLSSRARERWPDLGEVEVRFRTNFAYVGAKAKDGRQMPLCRLRYGGSAATWGFAVYLASRDGYEDSVLPSGASPARRRRPSTVPAGCTWATPASWRSSL